MANRKSKKMFLNSLNLFKVIKTDGLVPKNVFPLKEAGLIMVVA